MPVEAARILKQGALTCAMKYFEGDSNEGLALLNAMLQKLSINTKATKPSTTVAEKPRSFVIGVKM